MSIGKRILECIDKHQAGDAEAAFVPLCAVIEKTARQEYHQPGKAAFKRFIGDNFQLITRLAFGGPNIARLRLAFAHPDIKLDKDGLCGVEDLMYHAVRCGLYHEAQMPGNVVFAKDNKILIDPQQGVVLPASLVLGFIVATIASPANSVERLPSERFLNFGTFCIPFSSLWGRRGELLWLLDALDSSRAMSESKVTDPDGAQPSSGVDVT